MTEQHRNYYYAVRAKAERNANYDVSMIVDAAGGQGTIYQPRMMTVAKNEPERHTMLKTTCTFTKVHGLGTLITQSFPDLEGKGSNLTLECIYHALQTSITLKKMPRVRNLYVQVDNASSNKSWTLIAGLAALVLTGVVRKVRVGFMLDMIYNVIYVISSICMTHVIMYLGKTFLFTSWSYSR